jgi:hypothetical protein
MTDLGRYHGGVTDRARHEPTSRLIEFSPLAARLRTVASVLAVAALLAIVVDGMIRGLSFGVMVLWLSVFVVGLVLAAAVSLAVHALRGANSAQRRGERLAGDDVGWMPRRPGEPGA